MTARLLLVTGLGGAGRSTVAAATALAAAREGRRVLLLGDGPAAVEAPDLTVERVDADADFRAQATAFMARSGPAFDFLGAETLDEDELTPLPGADALALLRAVTREQDEGYDLVVADLPPAEEAARTLLLPAQLRRYLRRLLPPEKQAARALRPALAQLAGVPMPSEWLFGAAERFEAELALVQAVLESPHTSVTLVCEPGPGVVERLRPVRAGLALAGLAVDGVVANRVLPAGSADPWLAALADGQRAAAKDLHALGGFVHELPHLGHAPHTPDDLAALAVPAAFPGVPAPVVEDRRAEEGLLYWRLPLPGADRETLTLVRRGDELIVGTGPYRRVLPLPSALRRCRVAGAALADAALTVRFAPDPGLWPSAP